MGFSGMIDAYTQTISMKYDVFLNIYISKNVNY